MPQLAYILLGSNLGNSLNTMQLAAKEIERYAGKILSTSSFYKTAAWGKTNQNAFLNQVLLVQTELKPTELLHTLLNIETQMGRVRLEKWESRIIDLDILFYEDLIVDESNLKIPHPYIQERRFTLVPMVELSPNFVHPGLLKTMQELLQNCSDTLAVEKLGEN